MILKRQKNFTKVLDPDMKNWEKENDEMKKLGYKSLGGYADDKHRFYKNSDGKVIRIDKKSGKREEFESIYETPDYTPLVLDMPKDWSKKQWEEEKRKHKNK